MLEQQRWHAHPSDTTMRTDVSSTFVKPLHAGSSQYSLPYPYAAGTAIPPPPPELYPPLPPQSKRNRVYFIAFTLFVVLLGFLEVVHLAVPTLLTTYSSGSTGSNQAGISPVQHTMSPFKTTPVRILTPGTIKENMRLTCSGCNDPVHTTINSITIDTTNLRTVWTVTLNNQSGAQQTDYFAEFSLQDSFGNSYEGTGHLNADFFLNAGHIVFRTEIFSFLPRPDVSYILVARLGISGLTYDPLQFTF